MKNQAENKGEVVIYKTESGREAIDVRLENETVWLSQKAMAELLQKNSDTIGLHIRNIFKEKELVKESTTEYFSVVQSVLITNLLKVELSSLAIATKLSSENYKTL